MLPGQDIAVSVSEFVALLNGTMEYAFPSVTVTGELANFRVSKNRWVYFDLKDEVASVKCFGTIYQLSGPLEDGMLLQVRAVPRLHNLYGFSLNILHMQPTGEGTIKRASELLTQKLQAEGLFDEARKRRLPYPPSRIGLIASSESAAYADFMKILNARWQGVNVQVVDVQVQGEAAPAQLIAALEQLNQLAEPPEVIVMTRGGGSAEDLMAFSDERVTRAVAASRIPTLVAIGHEVDISLAELAADVRASTPSNAAELLVPDKSEVLRGLQVARKDMARLVTLQLRQTRAAAGDARKLLGQQITYRLALAKTNATTKKQLLLVLSPESILRRGFAIVRQNNLLVRRASQLTTDTDIELTFYDGIATATIKKGETT